MEIKYDGALIGRARFEESDPVGSEFATALATKIYQSFERMTNKAFYLLIEEHKCPALEPESIIEITNAMITSFDELGEMFVCDPDDHKYPFSTTASQAYMATNTANLNANYAGYVKVELIMFGEAESQNGTVPANEGIVTTYAPYCNVEDLLSIIFGHYYREIKHYYQAWHTQYMNAPDIASQMMT